MISLTCVSGGILVGVHVTPKAGQNAVLPYQPEDTSIRVKVTAVPEDGKANTAVLALLAKTLKLPKRSVSLHSGEQSRHKRVLIALDKPQQDILNRLAETLQASPQECFDLNEH